MSEDAGASTFGAGTPGGQTRDTEIRHASTVAWQGCGAMVEGPSGAGKSSLALGLMAYGAVLVADDRTLLRGAGDHVTAEAPPTLPALIEARGVGLLPARLSPPVPLRLVVSLSPEAQPRLPPERWCRVLGHEVALIVAPPHDHLAAAVLQMLKGFAGHPGG